MRSRLFLLLAVSLLGVCPTLACDSDAPVKKINEVDARFGATRVLKKLVSKQRIDASWADSEPLDVKSIDADAHTTWRIAFKNESAYSADSTLYIFLDEGGRYLGINRDGADIWASNGATPRSSP